MSDTNARFWLNTQKPHVHVCRSVFNLSPVFASRNLTADSKVGLNQGAVSISFRAVTGSHAPSVGKHSMRSECKCKSLIISNIKKRTKSLFLCCKTWFLPISLHTALQPCCIRCLKANKLSGIRQIYTFKLKYIQKFRSNNEYIETMMYICRKFHNKYTLWEQECNVWRFYA